MKYDLAAMVKASGTTRRTSIVLRPILPTQALAADLYAVCYRPIIEAMTTALPTILSAYERSVPIADAFHDAARDDVQNAQASLGDRLQRLILTLLPGLTDWTVRTERWHREKWRGAVLTATGIDPSTILLGSGRPESVQATIDWNTALIRDVAEQGRSRIGNLVFAAFQARKPVNVLAGELRDAVAMSKTRALGIASDQTKKLSAALDRERQTEAGVKRFKWRHSMKRHPRKIHVAHDGQIYAWSDPPTIDGAPDLPGQLPYCGCRAQAVLDLN